MAAPTRSARPTGPIPRKRPTSGRWSSCSTSRCASRRLRLACRPQDRVLPGHGWPHAAADPRRERTPEAGVQPQAEEDHPDEISYCQHAALEWQFLYADGQWFCTLTPTYHYTRDGHRDSLYLSELLSGIKRLDRNPAVYHQTRMWATYLHGEEGVLDPRETILDYGELLTHIADRGIDDAAWLADPRTADTASDDVGELEEADDDDPDDDPRLFEVEA